MKRLIAIILVLIIIFIGVCIYKGNSNKNKSVTAEEVDNIQNYISKIYMWKEVTGDALPKFDNINNASDLWVWETVKKNLENSELTYDEIMKKATELFGMQFTKQFPKEGTEYMQYNQELGEYISTGVGLDSLDDSFLIKNITKNKNEYKVEIAEYLVDYSNSVDALNADEAAEESENTELTNYSIYIKNLDEQTIATLNSTEISDGDTKIIEVVRDNIDKFTTKTVNLVKENNNIYVKSIE